jgi:hypothetical protein
MGKFSTFALLAFASSFAQAATSSAQPLGLLRWQLQPYCNNVTLAVVQQGGQYQLDGTDDQCGAAQAASVRGMAFQNLNGTIGFGLTIVTAPGGTPVHVDANTGNVTTADLASPPSLDGTLSAFSVAALTPADATIRTVSLTIPSSGTVIANATAMFQFPNNASVDGAWCSITSGTAVTDDNYLVAEERTADALTFATVASTRFSA